jgi:hypothetical protein
VLGQEITGKMALPWGMADHQNLWGFTIKISPNMGNMDEYGELN